jgi:hypothetical protein
MYCILYFFLFSLCNLFFTFSFSQAINGTWKGNSAKTIFIKHPQSIVVELSLSNDSIISGASHLYYKFNKYEHHKVLGKFNSRDSSVVFKENFIESNFYQGVFEVIYKMKLKSVGDVWYLEGNWKPAESLFGYKSYNKIRLEKPKDSATTSEKQDNSKKLNINDTLNKPPNRITDIQKFIEITSKERDSINIEVYDNGEIDGDSISLYLNNKSLMYKKSISDKAISFSISLPHNNKFNKLKMVAENLGSIPPNTALLIITTGKNRYEVRLASDLNKTAVIEFVLIE